MGEMSRMLEQEETISHAGQTYKLAPLTLEIQAQFEQWLESRAWDALDRQKMRLPPGVYESRAGKIFADIAADKYGFFSECSAHALSAPLGKGTRQLMFLRIKVNHPDATEALVWDIVETQAVEIERRMRAMDHDPNLKTPATETSSGESGKASNPSSPPS